MAALESHRFVYTFPAIANDAEGVPAFTWAEGLQPFGSELELDTNRALTMFQVGAGVFTSEECRRVIELGEARPKEGAGVGGAGADGRKALRNSVVAAIEPHEETQWLYHKLGAMFSEVNAFFDFELLGLVDPPQYTVYGSSQHYDWHIDVGTVGPASLRKLSLTVLLADGAAYEGGNLEFLNGASQEGQRAIGTAIFFPAFLPHRVSPVTSGVRRSLVAWACGPSFR